MLNLHLRHAIRTLRKSPGFAATAILTLALGIGASTAVFTVVDTILLRPLSYRDSGKLVVAWEHVRFLVDAPIGPNPRHVGIWEKRATAFSGLTVARNMTMGLGVDGDHPRVVGTVVSLANLFDVLQVQPLLGRVFLPEDGVKGHDDVVVLTYSLWQSLFRGDPGVIGKKIRVDDTPREIVGVLPAAFRFPNANALRAFRSSQPQAGVPEPSIFIPISFDYSKMEWNGNYGNFVTIGRLKNGFSIEAAETQLNAIQSQVVQEMPPGRRDNRPGALRASVQPMQEAIVGQSRLALWLLMGSVLGLMLIACLNLANAQLGRAIARRRDLAIRAALGAGKGRLIAESLAENFLLAAVGATAGLLLAFAVLELLVRYSPMDIPRLSEIQMNSTVLLFSVALTITATLITGILPAIRLVSIDPQSSLQENSSRAFGSRSGSRTRTLLIAVQVCGCTALLLVTGLLSRSLLHLLRQDKGFETEHVSIAEAKLPPKLYGEDQTRIAFIDDVLHGLRSQPGVEAAGFISAMPLDGESWIEPLRRLDRRNQESPLVNARWVSPGYFEATRQRLIAGRLLEERDRNLDSVVITQGEAKALWGNDNPIGSQVSLLGKTHTVIGVVADSRSTSLKTAPAKIAYVPYPYRPPYNTFFVLRSKQRPEESAALLRQSIWKSGPNVTLGRVKTLESHVSDSLSQERFQTLILISFGTAALLLAMVGIYGVLSYSVAARKQEIALRMAVGATQRSIYTMIFSAAGSPVFVGILAGLAVSIFAGQLIRTMLYGVQSVDISVILTVVTLLLMSAIAAAFVPARRAASVDPMNALRAD